MCQFTDVSPERAFHVALRASLAVLLVFAGALFVQRAWEIVQPLLVAIVLATALWPWVTSIAHARLGPCSWHVPRVFAAALVYVATFSLAGLAIWLALRAVLPELDRLLTAYPDQTAPIRAYLDPFRTGDLASGAGKLAQAVVNQAATGQPSASQASAPVNVPAFALATFGGVLQLGLVLVFTFFLLMEGDHCASWLIQWVPSGHQPRVSMLGLRIRDRISRWVLAQLLYGSISGAIIWIAMWALGLPDPWLYATIGATLGIFPGLGPWIAMVSAFVVTLGLSAWQAVAVAIFGTTIYIVDSTTLSTKIYGELLRLPMFAVLLALLVGGAVMGIWGALIAAPVAAGLETILEDHARHAGALITPMPTPSRSPDPPRLRRRVTGAR